MTNRGVERDRVARTTWTLLVATRFRFGLIRDARTTRSVGDGIPTRSVGTSSVRGVASSNRGRRGASGTAFPRGAWERVPSRRGRHSHAERGDELLRVGDGIPTRSVGTSCFASGTAFPRGAWGRVASRRGRHSHAERGNELLRVGDGIPTRSVGTSCFPSGTAFPRGAWSVGTSSVRLESGTCGRRGAWERVEIPDVAASLPGFARTQTPVTRLPF
jgi:hypothetical protein